MAVMIDQDIVSTIDRMRAQSTAKADRTNKTQLRGVVDGVKNPNTTIADIAQATGLSTDGVLDEVANLGTWLTHVYGAVNVEIKAAASITQPTLWLEPEENTVILPVGFERKGKQRRDVSKALAAIVCHDPDDTVLGRYLDRRYPSVTSTLGATDVYVVWRYSQLGRLSEIDEVSDNPAFCRVTVAAYDTLVDAIERATKGVAALCSPEGMTLDEIERNATSALWIHEAKLRRILERVEAARRNEKLTGTLFAELAAFARGVKAHPREWTINGIGDLREGQVMLIIRAAGLQNESGRREEAELRRTLIEKGLKADLDRLVPEGMRAIGAGLEDEFWVAIDRRLAGDEGWRDQLDEQLQEHIRS